ncbi:hypothetical protein CASFOL_003385 [Castilleja foliolosa]|uniref:Uncharacterized protein n=1 Tax=Castilleja foliolosa TaxID=1961234 RepID=A0ABD3EKW6_9LAMI
MPNRAKRFSNSRNSPPPPRPSPPHPSPPSSRLRPSPPHPLPSPSHPHPRPSRAYLVRPSPPPSPIIPDDSREKKDQAFIDGIKMLQQVRLCELWRTDLSPPDELEKREADFILACSCDECVPKLRILDEFEKEIQTKMLLIGADLAKINDKENLCMNISTSAQWSRDMFVLLNKKLKRLCEKLGVPCPPVRSNSADLLEHVDKTIFHRLREVGLIKSGNYSTVGYDEEDNNILEELETGRWYYRNTKCKVEVYLILQDMESLEKDWKDQKIDENLKLVQQIKCVEKLPVNQLQDEVEVLISQIFPVEFHTMREEKARDLICKTSYYCIKKRNEFWQGSLHASLESSHASLEATLDSIIQEVGLFKEQWNKEFAPVFENQDGSGPKSQLVEKAKEEFENDIGFSLFD